MGSNLPSTPVVFIKPSTSYNITNKISIPEISNDMHYEVELVCRISKDAENISEKEALDFIDAFAIGIDFTLRDIQNNAKKEGNPWSISKGFFGSASVGSFIDKIDIQDYNNLKISLKLNGELKQFGYTKNMIFKIPFIVSYLSNIFTLKSGDLIFTGTPEGVGKVDIGDVLECSIVDYVKSNLIVNVV
jgi:2-keto-4-pentenoate hydratase/2-oxohepta-3-ene-1,7-dioic acid hydratase in catechol pathway